MSENSIVSPSPIPQVLLPRFEEVCNRFAVAWENNLAPDIGEFAAELKQAESRRQLIGVLLALEVRLRTASGESPSPSEYRSRFPDFDRAIRFAFQEANHMVRFETDGRAEPHGDAGDKQQLLEVPRPTGTQQRLFEFKDLPKKLGRYEMIRPLGQGGFGLVCLAKDTMLDRKVALKIARHATFESREHLSAFIREARIAAKLEHPAIVTIYDIKRFEEILCIVQQYIPGKDLRLEIREQLPTFHRTAEICKIVAEGIGYAHQQGFFHRDIKPANILIDRSGQPYIADFGLAIHESAQRRRRGERTGTPRFMSPELVLGETHRIDGRSDVWSLGVLMYDMLTGNRAFKGESLDEIFDEIQHRDPVPPRQLKPDIPAELERICLKCLSKRIVNRYHTAQDLAEDLQLWIQSVSEAELTASVAQSHSGSQETLPPSSQTVDQSGRSKSATFRHLEQVNIIPRGLKSFEAHDADFFLHLLPGPRDRDGFPESIRFWRNRIETDAIGENDGVGLIYGPSGCGKSSFVKAGLIPILQDRIVPVYIEATGNATESRLVAAIKRAIPNVDATLPIGALLDSIRDGSWLPREKKLLIVIDQFEQWLHNHNPSQLTELARAIRHCDGTRIECLLMVRDDFWLATSRFMRTVEVDLLEGRNATLIDLFDKQHARKVLCEYGQAYNALPSDLSSLTKPQTRFLREVIEGLAEQDKVICVRLATFVEMFKDRPWNSNELDKVGGLEGVGIKFLEDTFESRLAKPEHRLHEPAARKFLGALLSEVGSGIRGNMRSAEELIQIVGYENRLQSFADLTRILDQELRLVTLTDPLGLIDETNPTSTDEAHYQLTHDFLVTPLRQWLTQHQQSTMRGRAKLRLEKRCATWSTNPLREYLPGLLESANIMALTKPGQWTPQESKMMKQAGWMHGFRIAVVVFILAAAGWFTGQIYFDQQANNLVDRLLEAETTDVPSIISMISHSSKAIDKVDLAANDPDIVKDRRKKLHLSLARLPYDPTESTFLAKAISSASPDEAQTIILALQEYKDEHLDSFWALLDDETQPARQTVRIAASLAQWDAGNSGWSAKSGLVLTKLMSLGPLEIKEWAKLLLPIKQQLLPTIVDRIARDEAQTRTLVSLFPMFAQDTESMGQLIAQERDLLDPLATGYLDQWGESGADTDAGGIALSDAAKAERKQAQKAFVAVCRRQANLVAADIALGNVDPINWTMLRTDSLTRRSFLIQQLNRSGIEPDVFIKQLKRTTDPGIRSALLFVLGDAVAASPYLSKTITPIATEIYCEDQDAQVHSAAEWVLRQLDPKLTLAEIRSMHQHASKPAKATWSSVGDDITMIRISAPGTARLIDGSESETSWGSPVSITLDRDYWISSKEIGLQQFMAFSQDYDFGEDGPPSFADQDADFDDHPAVSMTWSQAASFCNWLSEKENIPREQWCYEIDTEFDAIKLGKPHFAMKLVDDWETKKGFRMPTEFEWEYACQAETLTTWCSGAAVEQLVDYAWFEMNTVGERRAHIRGLLKPNRFGLFDMHGNVSERTSTKFIEPIPTSASSMVRYVRKGGRAFSESSELSCSYSGLQSGFTTSNTLGFRIVRLAE